MKNKISRAIFDYNSIDPDIRVEFIMMHPDSWNELFREQISNLHVLMSHFCWINLNHDGDAVYVFEGLRVFRSADIPEGKFKLVGLSKFRKNLLHLL